MENNNKKVVWIIGLVLLFVFMQNQKKGELLGFFETTPLFDYLPYIIGGVIILLLFFMFRK